jgi:hypothetical protein
MSAESWWGVAASCSRSRLAARIPKFGSLIGFNRATLSPVPDPQRQAFLQYDPSRAMLSLAEEMPLVAAYVLADVIALEFSCYSIMQLPRGPQLFRGNNIMRVISNIVRAAATLTALQGTVQMPRCQLTSALIIRGRPAPLFLLLQVATSMT